VPPWSAVCENRDLYRVVSAQLFDLLLDTYCPPRGCRVIVDAVALQLAAPHTLDEWLNTNRVWLSEAAAAEVAGAREKLRGDKDWRAKARALTKRLAMSGALKSVPMCVETGEDGTTYAPFPLPEAANSCGEADVGVFFWFSALGAERQHITLRGARRACSAQPDAVSAQFYSAEALEEDAAAREMDTLAAPPRSLAERRANQTSLLEQNADWRVVSDKEALRTIAEILPLERASENVLRAPNRGLILSSDTDFIALALLWYAQLRHQHPDDARFCLEHAPLASLGECRLERAPPNGWIAAFGDYWTPTTAAQAKKMAAAGQAPPKAASEALLAHEVWDIGELYKNVVRELDASSEPAARLNAVLSFATMTASCGNDFLRGLAQVNRRYQWLGLRAAMRASGALAQWPAGAQYPLVRPERYVIFLKYVYHAYALERCAKDKRPPPSAAALSFERVARYVDEKHTKTPRNKVARGARLALMYERLNWWLAYATCAARGVCHIRDDRVWGWRTGNGKYFV